MHGELDRQREKGNGPACGRSLNEITRLRNARAIERSLAIPARVKTGILRYDSDTAENTTNERSINVAIPGYRWPFPTHRGKSLVVESVR